MFCSNCGGECEFPEKHQGVVGQAQPQKESRKRPAFGGKPWVRGASHKKFTFTYTDMASVLGLSEVYVRQLVSRGKLEPTLQGVAGWLWAKMRKL